MFATIGVEQWFRYAVGVIELAGAVGLLVPRLAGLAALGLAADMIGAMAVQDRHLPRQPVVPRGRPGPVRPRHLGPVVANPGPDRRVQAMTRCWARISEMRARPSPAGGDPALNRVGTDHPPQ